MAADYEKNSKVGAVADALAGALSSDLAMEIRAEFEGRISVGFDVPAATGHVFGKFHAALSSPQEGPVVLIALAALQLREGYLQAVIRDAGLDLIESGEALNAYRSMNSGQRKATREMLNQLADMLQQTHVQDDES